MNLFELVEKESEMLIKELKARCEQLYNAFGANSHAHIDPVIDSLEAHVAAKTPNTNPDAAAPTVASMVEAALAPVVDTPTPPAPVVDTPIAPAPVVDTPIAPAPVVDTPIAPAPVVESTPVVEAAPALVNEPVPAITASETVAPAQAS